MGIGNKYAAMAVLAAFWYPLALLCIAAMTQLSHSTANAAVFGPTCEPGSTSNVRTYLRSHLFCQGPAINSIVTHLNNFVWRDNPLKPLVMFLFGGPGVGKSYAAELIKDSLFTDSRCTLTIPPQTHLKHASREKRVQEAVKLENKMLEFAKFAPRGIIIIEEAEHMPEEMALVFHRVANHNREAPNVRNMFIFTFNDNLARVALTEHMAGLVDEWGPSEAYNRIDSYDAANAVEAVYLKAGSGAASRATPVAMKLLESHLVDARIPLMPLTGRCVIPCLESVEFAYERRLIDNGQAKSLRVSSQVMDCLSSRSVQSADENLFVKSGCKVSERVFTEFVAKKVEESNAPKEVCRRNPRWLWLRKNKCEQVYPHANDNGFVRLTSNMLGTKPADKGHNPCDVTVAWTDAKTSSPTQ